MNGRRSKVKLLKRLVKDQRGIEAVEYALIFGLAAVVAIAVFMLFKTKILALINEVFDIIMSWIKGN